MRLGERLGEQLGERLGKSAKLYAIGCAALATLSPNALESAVANGDTRTLFLFHSHSKETIAATFRTGGSFSPARTRVRRRGS